VIDNISGLFYAGMLLCILVEKIHPGCIKNGLCIKIGYFCLWQLAVNVAR
jgi:hypothetical protein